MSAQPGAPSASRPNSHPVSRASRLLWGLCGLLCAAFLLRWCHQGILFQAAEQGDVARLQLLLQLGADPNAVRAYESDTRGKGQEALLLLAAMHQEWKAVHLLLKAGANPNVNDGSHSPLAYAVDNGEVEAVQDLLRHHADPNTQSSMGAESGSVLHEAIGRSRPIVEALLNAGANANAPSSMGGSPLQSAIINDHFEIVQLLLAHGADVNARRPQEEPILTQVLTAHAFLAPGVMTVGHMGVKSAKTVPSGLPKKAVKVQAPKVSQQIEDKEEAMVRLLLEHGADLNARGPMGLTPLQVAKQMNRLRLVALLRKAGARG